ncbi:MAG TPA: indole-3-glycerol phosphate synthase TrpC [Verrucomicrobiae bacterium]|jgi:indole-3-glycerol phosphate synthase|nr:indole-3-glycerol phosphate synthase TrpC [Verrucomicrobiae bacterium]
MNILDKIVAEKEREVASLPRRDVLMAAGRRDFHGALRKPRRGKVALIAEVKKASPSAGVICADFDPVRIAREYEAAGADCLSVLTDVKFFQGSLKYLQQIREAVKLPLLRKDFIIDERQIPESIDNGADAILLIVRILDDARLKRFHALATGAGLSVLVEAHDAREMDRALAIGATLIGVNNRNLDNFTVDLSVTRRLAARVSNEATLVAESGIHSRADVEALAQSGAKAILVGEALMRNPAGIAAKVSDLLGPR